jgi:Tfp pilus assembly protein PilO
MVTRVKERNLSTVSISRSVNNKPFGLTYIELAFLVISLISLIGVGIYYYSTLSPELNDVKALKQQIETLNKTEKDILSLGDKQKIVQEDKAKIALESLDSFKSGYLKGLSQGRIALIDNINNTAKKDGVRLMSGIAMSADKPDIEVSTGKKVEKKKGVESLSTVYPSLKINFTVGGEYKNLRDFIKDIEASKQFLTINSISLTSVKDKEGGGGRGASRRGTQTFSGISLVIDMTAFFQS